MGDEGEVGGGGRRRVDAGWLYLLAGGATLLSAALIPAYEDAASAEAQADRARAQADHQARRLERYADTLDALDRGDATLLASLAATNLHVIPAGKRVVHEGQPGPIADTSANLFEQIEPPPPTPPPTPTPTDSTLARLARGERSRLALIAGALLCLLVGTLPATPGDAGRARGASP